MPIFWWDVGVDGPESSDVDIPVGDADELLYRLLLTMPDLGDVNFGTPAHLLMYCTERSCWLSMAQYRCEKRNWPYIDAGRLLNARHSLWEVVQRYSQSPHGQQ